jgi:NAD(P)-dependent dehydrogenase (short-subunit alcohol dehydrogenase family)
MLPQGYVDGAAAVTPMGRLGRPEDIADAVLMLMTNGFITGIVLDVDGGGLIA